MATATLPRKRERKPKRVEPEYQFGLESNGILMSPEEFDAADPGDFDECWDYELINGVLIVSSIPAEPETDANEQLGCWLRNFEDAHENGYVLDATLSRQYIHFGNSRRKADRVVWAGLGRLPRRGETPTVIAEFVSKRKRDCLRDYETKRAEYQAVSVEEYWIIDRFKRTMMIHTLEDGEYRKKVLHTKQTYRTKLLPGFELPFAKLLALADRWDEQTEEETP